ncbi:MAG: hypothetical protein ABI548_02935 [Polyangiaceae bacterium]
MNQYAGTLIVCVCLGAVVAIGSAGCDNASDPAGAAGAGTAGAGSVGTAGTAPVGTAGAPPGTAGAAADGVPLPVGDTGFVSLPMLGIQGSWYGYGDGQGSDGSVAMSDCIFKGMHMPADCSMITTPMFGSFAPTPDKGMCTAGTAAKVINLAPCPIVPPATVAPTVCPDYSNLFGAGIGLDLNNAGNDGGTGMKLPFDATAAGIIGISFDLDTAPPASGMRVEFPTVGTENTSAMWKPGTANKSPLVAGHNVLMFADVKSPTFVTPAVPFDPSKLLSIQFHIPTVTAMAVPFAFCINNLSVITTAPAAM